MRLPGGGGGVVLYIYSFSVYGYSQEFVAKKCVAQSGNDPKEISQPRSAENPTMTVPAFMSDE